MTSTTPPRRRWFRFSLRTFFGVLTIFGVWMGVQVKWIRDRNEVKYSHWTYYGDDVNAPWSIHILGEEGVELIGMEPTWDRSKHPEEYERLHGLFPEARIEPVTPPPE